MLWKICKVEKEKTPGWSQVHEYPNIMEEEIMR
jgi:hypothetical protein